MHAGLGQINDKINVGTPNPFDGEIAIFRFYESELSAAEVQDAFDRVAAPWNLLTITQLNGVAYTPGTPVVLPSGSTVTLNADGSYTYDPTTQPAWQALNNGESASDSFTYTITDGSGTATATVDLTIDGRNDQLSATNLTQTKNYNEDGGNVAIDNIVVSDADASDIYTVTLTLSDTSTGLLTANDGAIYTPGTGVWTITGDAATVNTALANVEFIPAANNNTDSYIDVVIADGNEDGAVTVTGRIDLVATAVNDAPVATVPVGPIAVSEDQFVSITGVSFSDIDAGGADVTVTLNVADGTLTVDDTVVGGLGTGDIGGNGTAA